MGTSAVSVQRSTTERSVRNHLKILRYLLSVLYFPYIPYIMYTNPEPADEMFQIFNESGEPTQALPRSVAKAEP